MLQGVVHPLFEFGAAERGTRGIVGVTQVNHVGGLVGQRGHKAVGLVAGAVGNAAPGPVTELASTAAHHVRVDVDGVNRVGDADGVVPPENIAKAARVALGTVVHKNLVGINLYAARRKVIFHNGTAQKFITVLGAVAAESVGSAHFIDSLVQGRNDGRGERPRDVANAQTYDLRFGMRILVGGYLLRNVGKEVVLLQFQKVLVNRCHVNSIYMYATSAVLGGAGGCTSAILRKLSFRQTLAWPVLSCRRGRRPHSTQWSVRHRPLQCDCFGLPDA